MACRLASLKQILIGYLKTGVPLIEFNGADLVPAFTADDIGIYVIIPKIAALFNLDIYHAINLFFFGILLIPCLVGIIGFCFYYQSWLQRFIAIIGVLLITRQAYSIGDVYLSYVACPVAIIPWALYFAKNNIHNTPFFNKMFFFFSGMYLAFFHYIRTYSGIGALLFIISLFSLIRVFSKKQLCNFLFIFLGGAALPTLYFNHAYNTSVAYSKENLQHQLVGEKNHVFWHNIYIGFGFLKFGNVDNISYDDSFAFNKAREIDPKISLENTKQYEEILKNEIINLIKNHWNFVLLTIFAKIGILLLFLLKYANFGLLCALLFRKPWYFEIPFLFATAFYALFPLLTVPLLEYTLGFIACVSLYGIISINYALEQSRFLSLFNHWRTQKRHEFA
jgi:hypothetical protein